MAVVKVLAVQTGPSSPDIDLIIGLDFDGQRGSFTGTGDNAIAIHGGRVGFITGRATVEDATTAQALLDLDPTEAAFTCLDDTGTATITLSSFMATGNEISLGDGLAVGAAVPGYSVPFEATAIALS